MARYTPKNRADWRRWLKINHEKASEIWLVFRKKHTKNPNLSYNDAVEEAVCFGWVDGMKRSVDEDRYMHRFTPRKSRSQWSQSNRNRVERMEAAGQMMPAGRRSVDAAKASGAWENPA